jgi:DNA repair protein RadD
MVEREYQTAAIDKTFEYLNATTGDGLVLMPTGTGKSHVIGGIIKRALMHGPNRRIQMLVNSKEIIQQNYDKLLETWPGAPVGIYSAGLNTKQAYMPVTMAGIKSVKSKAQMFGHTDLCLIDEAHRVPQDDETEYRAYINELREINPYMRVVGFTATGWRMGQGKLTDPGGLFTDTIIDQTQLHIFNRFFDEGYLVRLVSRPMQTKLDVSGIGMSGGDLNMAQVQKRVDKAEITWQALQELVSYGIHRRKWLIFASGVEHADHIAEMLNRMGFPTTVVHKGVKKKDRDQRIAEFKAGGKWRCIVNNNILTTGFDDPGIDLIGVLRPSMSSSLWVQMLGRGTRPLYAKGFDLSTIEGRLLAIANSYKQNCLVLDFAHNTSNLGPINDPVLPRAAGGGGGGPPIKICETQRLKHRDKGVQGCGWYNHPSYRFCEECSAEFDFAVKFGSESSNVSLISDGEDNFEWFDIQFVGYSRQIGASGVPYLRVDYWYTDKKKWTDYVNLEHTGFVQHRAHQWFLARFKHPEWGPPPTVAEALKYCNNKYMREPVKIRVWKNKEPLPEIVNYEYE